MKSCNSCVSADKRMHEYPCVECHGYSEYEEMVEMATRTSVGGKIVQDSAWEVTPEKYANYVYDLLKHDCEGMDSIYEDYIINCVGVNGFTALHEFGLLESCGLINGRQLYVLCGKTE